MPLATFSLTGKASVVATSTSQSVALPLTGSPTTCLVCNLAAQSPCYVILSTSAGTLATPSNAVPVLPGQALALTLGSNTYASVLGSGPVDLAMGI